MIRILDRYVALELSAPFFIGVGVLTFFLVIDRVYQLTDLVVTKQVPFQLVLSLPLFLLPPLLSLTLPVALLLAVLIACGRLTEDLEVAALKASGVGSLRLFRPFLVAGLLVSALVGCLTLIVNPWASSAFQKQLFKILQSRAATAIQEREFSGAFAGIVLYVEEVSPSQVALRGILASDERNPGLSRIIVAREGRVLSDEEQRRLTFRFIEGAIAENDVRDLRRFRYTSFSLYDMNISVAASPRTSGQEGKPEREMGLGQLVAAARAAGRDQAKAAPYWVELHKRFALPAAALVFLLVGFPLGVRSRRGGRAAALAWSFAVVVSYYILSTSLEGPALNGRLPPGLAIWLPDLLFGLLGLWLLRTATAGVPAGWVEAFRHLAALLETFRARWEGRSRAARHPVRLRGLRASTFIIDRYLIRQYLLLLGVGLLVGGVFSLVVDLLQSLDRFLRTKPPWIYIAQHFLYLFPRELYKGLPLIVLVATVFLFLSLTRQRELDALKAAGVSLYRVCLPILAMAFLISALALIFQETALPEITARAEEVDRVKIRGYPPRHLLRQEQMWYRSSDRRFLRIALLDPVAKSLDGLTVLSLDPDFRLASRFDAGRAEWTPDGWRVWTAVTREVSPSGQIRSTAFDYRVVGMPEHIDDFIRVQKPPDTMSFLELRAYVNKLREGGHQVGAYLGQLYSKLSFPLIHLIMALVAIPFALMSPQSGGRAVGIGLAIVISVGYWMVHSLALAFARADLLPPALAAWTANIIFAGLGAALLLNART
jgi:LPS export ABC transporter permease LptG/LPS export ABC transporter permease LptF